jgi:oxygen-independent coproporphyrinogen-3 oxidase
MQKPIASSQQLTANSQQPIASSQQRTANGEQRTAGLYLHIPFCKQACSYCNFHFSTSLSNKDDLLKALHEEINQRSEYLESAELASIYFGGGTPSLLSAQEINSLLETIAALHQVSPDAEITIEANPDDLTSEKISALRDTSVNRLSIGIQSFYEDELKYMNRAHNAKEGIIALERAMQAGFKSLTMDLIYGTPFLTEQRWIESLHKVGDIGIPHLSAYQLTIEPKTALGHQINKGLSPAPNDDATVRQFEMLMDWAEASGYEHYEISNLARHGHRAIHNSNYWKGIPYLGIGPSAHSFNGREREWNIANNTLYIKGIIAGSAREGIETLTDKERYNEYVMTGLRTIDGVQLEKIRSFGQQYLDHFNTSAKLYLESKQLVLADERVTLTMEGKLFADRIAAELFMV